METAPKFHMPDFLTPSDTAMSVGHEDCPLDLQLCQTGADQYVWVSSAPLPKADIMRRSQVVAETMEVVDRMHRALRELVALKDIQDREGKTEDYEARKGAAWFEARSVIAELDYINQYVREPLTVNAPKPCPVCGKPRHSLEDCEDETLLAMCSDPHCGWTKRQFFDDWDRPIGSTEGAYKDGIWVRIRRNGQIGTYECYDAAQFGNFDLAFDKEGNTCPWPGDEIGYTQFPLPDELAEAARAREMDQWRSRDEESEDSHV